MPRSRNQKSPSSSIFWMFISQLLVYFWSLSSQTHPCVDCDKLNAGGQRKSSTGIERRLIEPSSEEQDTRTYRINETFVMKISALAINNVLTILKHA